MQRKQQYVSPSASALEVIDRFTCWITSLSESEGTELPRRLCFRPAHYNRGTLRP